MRKIIIAIVICLAFGCAKETSAPVPAETSKKIFILQGEDSDGVIYNLGTEVLTTN